MGTRSTIAMKTEEGIRGVYCHWDGYIDHNGTLLTNFYKDEASAKKLIDLGDLSSLGEVVGEVHAFDQSDDSLGLTKNWCMSYHRDRGENWADVAPQTYTDAQDWIASFANSGIEYAYLFNGDDWLVHKLGDNRDGSPVFEYVEVALLKQIVS
jgi:hypothetical protein|tara:strand:+ start:112 stop:570 length:459 start_codon:yes stop_codon:yes gene_type:complete